MDMRTTKEASAALGSARRTARFLGWFSIALGTAELLMPRAVGRACGMEADARLVRLYGLREIACGIGILRSADARPWLWARVGGDVVDMATLAAGSGPRTDGAAVRRGMAVANVVAIAAVDVRAARDYRRVPRLPVRDYSDCSGYRGTPDDVRGAALKDFQMPRDMRGPDALLPWKEGRPQALQAAAA